MVFNRTSWNKGRLRGLTLVEYMFATTIGVVVLGASLILWGFASRTAAMLYGYVDLAATSKHALDSISQQIRNARTVQSCSATQLVLSVPSDLTTNNATVTFGFNSVSQMLVLTVVETNQATRVKTLLTRCTNFQFSVFQRTPKSNTFDVEPLVFTNTAKVVTMQWRCTRPLRGDQEMIEDQVSAKVVIRSK
jgi:Tfp pilus assembly protein PilW